MNRHRLDEIRAWANDPAAPPDEAVDMVFDLLDEVERITPGWRDGEPPVPSSRGLVDAVTWVVWREGHERPVLTYRLTVDDTVVFLNSLGQWQPWSTPQAARWAPTCRPENTPAP